MKWLYLLVLMPALALASGDRIYNETNSYYTSSTSSVAGGTALAIATAQHQFDWGTYQLQGSLAVGGYEGESAISFGLGWRPNKDRMLLNGSIGIEEGKIGYGGAMNWRF